MRLRYIQPSSISLHNIPYLAIHLISRFSLLKRRASVYVVLPIQPLRFCNLLLASFVLRSVVLCLVYSLSI